MEPYDTVAKCPLLQLEISASDFVPWACCRHLRACAYELSYYSVHKVVTRSSFGVIRRHKVRWGIGRVATVRQGRIQILDGSWRTGAFRITPITANYTACCVNNSDEMGRPGRRFCRRVKLLTVGCTNCGVKGSCKYPYMLFESGFKPKTSVMKVQWFTANSVSTRRVQNLPQDTIPPTLQWLKINPLKTTWIRTVTRITTTQIKSSAIADISWNFKQNPSKTFQVILNKTDKQMPLKHKSLLATEVSLFIWNRDQIYD